MEGFAENEIKVPQRLLVMADGVRANIFLQEKNPSGGWDSMVSSVGWIGRNGLGKEVEGDGKTPLGSGRFLFGFGIKENPGTVFPYMNISRSHYLVDDCSSEYYNQIVSEDMVKKDWSSAEHLVEMGRAYHYALATDYNVSCERGRGSGIFFHCENGKPTAGCVSLPEKEMKQIMKEISQECIWQITDCFAS
ncbi:MAG TPA: hypothetical protein DCR27_00600 [Lachnospiraceae bacterium]|nr:hypothetical protein [Lachnospiraceae bacterium]